jgi:hypothetical protein
MEINIRSVLTFFTLRTVLFDSLGILVILLIPAISHLTAFPVYYFEPMRIMIILALLFTSRPNAYSLAIALPLFSYLVSGHPFPLKMVIIIAELLLNVWLFVSILRISRMPFLSMFSSILLSKVFCYLVYWIVISWAFVVEEADMKFIVVQIALALILSSIIWLGARKIGNSAI